MTHFKNLLNRMLNGTATEAERSEFLVLVKTGKFDHELTGEDLEKLSEVEFEVEATSEVYKRIEADQFEPARKIIPFRRSSTWLAAAAIIVMAVVAGTWYIASEQQWFNSQTAAAETEDWIIHSGKQFVDLPDGSKVVLNENSELKYRLAFGQTTREVSLTGEATFDVAHDPSKPFLVQTGKVSTKVLGTEFNVKAYPDQPQVTVTVLRGLVEVRSEERIYGQIKPNEQIAVNTATNDFVQQETNAETAVEWKSNFLILDNVSLEEAATIIGEKFNVQIRFENEALKKCRFVGTFLNDENLDDVLSIMTRTMRIKFEKEENTNAVILRGKGCA